MTDLIKLATPFKDGQIHYRVGATNVKKVKAETGNNNARPTSGLALAYIDARDAYDRFDEVCGVDGWQDEFYDVGNGLLGCRIGVRVRDGEWIWKSHGAGGRSSGTGLSSQDANKGNFSDAFKTAAVAWGVGRYLYGIKSQWVSIDKYGQIKDGMRSILDRAHQAVSHGKEPVAREPDDADPQDIKPERRSKTDSRDDYTRLEKDIRDEPTISGLEDLWKRNFETLGTMHQDYVDSLIQEAGDRKKELKTKLAA